MFTGIIREIGIVRRLDKIGPSYRLEIESAEVSKDLVIGDSVSVDGACLTLVEKKSAVMAFDVMEETVKRTSLTNARSGHKVNLEGALRAGEELGGHFVLGHVDCMGQIIEVRKDKESCILIEFPEKFAKLVVEKGSVAIDGISLTVGEVSRNKFDVYVIPHTLKVTTLGLKCAGSKVNLEFDIIGKYLSRFDQLNNSEITDGYLREKGFC